MQNKLKKSESLRLDWESLKSENKKIRIRDAANQLGVSEADLLSTQIGENTFLLSINDYSSFFKDIFSLDKIMLLIRSDSVVHEKIVEPKNIEIKTNEFIYNHKPNCPILKFDINLFKHVFYESKEHQKTQLKSFQFFNSHGIAILKIYLKGNDYLKFNEIGLKHRANKSYNFQLDNKTNLDFKSNISINDINLYFKDKIKDLKKTEYHLNNNPLREILINASKLKIPIQIHAIGLGTIQYHRDVVKKIIDYGPWVNVIDKNFNLHVLEKNLNKFILTKYKNSEYCLIDFFDQEKRHVLGITSIIGNENKFSKIINKLGEAK